MKLVMYPSISCTLDTSTFFKHSALGPAAAGGNTSAPFSASPALPLTYAAALQILVTVTPVTMAREKKMPKLAAALIRGGQSAPQQQPVNQQKAAPPSQPQQGSTGPAASGGAGVPPLLLQKGYDVLGVIGEVGVICCIKTMQRHQLLLDSDHAAAKRMPSCT
jgi:hypothetical protein